MSTQEKSGGTLSSAFTKGEYTYGRRGSAVATGDIRITDPKPSADHNIVTDPQPFPRRFLGEYQVDDENHLQSRHTDRNVVGAPFGNFPNTRFASRDSTAINIPRLVTDLVTVNGNIYPDMGQVLPGLRLLDGRYLFAGLLANLFGIISIFFNVVTFGVTEPFLAAAMIVSGWFTVGGFMKKGSLNSTTAEGLLLGNFPIWTFGFWSIPLSLDDYYRNLSICQVEQFLGSSTTCTGAQTPST